MKENIILVDKNDKKIGIEEKILVHKEGKLHRAFSVFIFNSKEELLLQKRATNKYHSPNLWTNTCCGHPREGEEIIEAARRRLKEEMGFSCLLAEKYSFIYKIKFENNLFEHEYDHVLFGKYNNDPNINPEEASSFKWINLNDLKKDIKNNPADYTYWLKLSLNKVILAALE